MSHQFVTETIQEPIPLLIAGDSGVQFLRHLIEVVSSKYPEFSPYLIELDKKNLAELRVIPYMICWIEGFEGSFQEGLNEEVFLERAKKIMFLQKEYSCPVSLITTYTQEEIPKSLLKILGGITTLFIETDSPPEKEAAFLVLKSAIQERNTGGERRVRYQGLKNIISQTAFSRSLPKPEYQEKREVQIKPPVIKPISGGVGREKEILEKEGMLPNFSHLPQERIIEKQTIKSEVGRGEILQKKESVLEGIFQKKMSVSKKADKIHRTFDARRPEKKQSHSKPLTQEKGGVWETVKKYVGKLGILRKPQAHLQGKKTSVLHTLARVMLSSLFLSMFLFIGVLVVFSYSREQVKQVFQSLQASFLTGTGGDVQKGVQNAQFSKQLLQYTLPVVQPAFSLLGRGAVIEDASFSLRVLENQLSIVTSLRDFSDNSRKIFEGVMGIQDHEVFGTISAGEVLANNIGKDVSMMVAELRSFEDLSTILLAKEDVIRVKDQLLEIRKKLLSVQHFYGLLPKLLGQEKKRTYLVLIQNPLELRATGGFISTVGFFTVDKGRLLNFEFKDSYTVDSQLNGKVSPPEDLKKFLGEEQWFLRDSNWSADFPTAARQAEWFVQKEMGVEVDGTLGLDAYALKELLLATGPIRVEQYGNEDVTSENLFERLQTRTEWNFSMKNQNRREYMTEVVDALVSDLSQKPPSSMVAFGSSLVNSFEESHMFLASKNDEEDHLIGSLGWSGKVMSPLCPQQFTDVPCTVDTVFVVESNVGINRANYYVNRYAAHEVTLDSSRALHVHTIQFTNNAKSSAWPSGPYKNYVRLYLPLSAQLEEVKNDGVIVSSDRIFQAVENGKKVVGVLVDVPVSKSVKMVTRYSTSLPSEKRFSYALFIQKQAGIEGYPAISTIRVLKPLRTLTVAPEATITQNVAQFEFTFEKHHYMAVELERQE